MAEAPADAVGRSAAPGRLPDPADVPRPWLDAYPPGVPPTYQWRPVALPRLLDDAARDFPEVAGVVTSAGRWTWQELDDRATTFAAALTRAGVRPGDRVGLALRNGPAAVVAAFGTWRAGGVLVLLDPDLPTAARLATLAATTPTVTVVEEDDARAWVGTGHRVVASDAGAWAAPGRLDALRARLTGLRRRSVLDEQMPAIGAHPVGWSAFVADVPEPGPVAVGPDDPAVLAPTADADGRRRVVVLAHRNLVANAFQARLWVPDVQAGREVLLAAVPFTHLYGLTVGLLATTLAAGTIAVADAPEAPSLLACIGQARPTLLPSEPGLLGALVDAAERRRTDLSSLRACLVGGEPLRPDVADRLRFLSGGARVRRGHGVAEAGTLTHANPVYGRARLDRIGLPVTSTVAAVVDPGDPAGLLDDGQPGRLAVAGPQVMAGYWRDPGATAAVLRDGWLLTRHLAVRDATGAFAIVGDVRDTGAAKEVAE